MATYFQWKSKHPEFRSLYYICGSEASLRDEVLDAVKQQWPDARHVQRDCAKDSYAEVLDAVSMDTSGIKTVATLRNVDKLTDQKKQLVLSRAEDIVGWNLPNLILIVYTEEDNPDTMQELYRPFVKSGRFVECKQLSVDSMKKFAIEGYKCTEEAADLLVELVSYNFRRLNNELEKLSCLDLPEITERHIKQFVVFEADDLFLNKMLIRSRDQAKQVVSAVPQDTIPRVLNQLTKKLAFLYQVIINDAPGIGAHKLAGILGVQPWQLLEYFAIKKYWTASAILEKLKLLTVMEAQYTSHKTNILGLLAAWW